KALKKNDWERLGRERLEKLLRDQSPGADEAVAALVGIYLGEDPGEHIDEASIARGYRILPWMRKFRDHEIETGLDPVPESFHLKPADRAETYNHLIQCIETGEPFMPRVH
ncbi:MAG TPA: hypothetical protein VL181_07645, partial [Holophagaceae bacterium]|nr:hypothetical protein [Holophagaceae bacterium]